MKAEQIPQEKHWKYLMGTYVKVEKEKHIMEIQNKERLFPKGRGGSSQP